MVSEALAGYQLAHRKLITVCPSPLYVHRTRKGATGKVAIISGGGSGHEPLHIGMVGRGMLDAACPGQIFTSPTPQQILAACESTNPNRGVLFLVKNYAGDRMNFEMASEELTMPHATILVGDEATNSDNIDDEHRRGLSGIVLYEKMIGALAESGANLEECVRLGHLLHSRIRSIGVALTRCELPGSQKLTNQIPEEMMEVGIGIHGEPGRDCRKIMNADEIADLLITTLARDLHLSPGDELLLFVNGMGSTPAQELYLLYKSAAILCSERGYSVARSLVGNYVTSLNMQGCSITLCRLSTELKELWDAPVETSTLRWGV